MSVSNRAEARVQETGAETARKAMEQGPAHRPPRPFPFLSRLLPAIPPRVRAYAHVATSRLRSYRGVTSPPPLPHACHLVLTWRCNLRCHACAAWSRQEHDELTADQWRDVFAQMRSLDIIKIIGGEPFLRSDIGEVVEAARQEINPFIVQLVTNGVLVEDTLRFADRHGWPGLHLRVSLDGLESTHDASRGVPGSFYKAMTTLRGLSEIRRHKGFSLAVNFTLTDKSLGDMDELVDRCGAMGVDVIPGFPVKPFLRNADLDREKVGTIGVRDRDAHLQRLQRTDHGARRGFNRMERRLLRGLNRLVYRKHVSGGDALRFPCAELRQLAYFMPNSDLVTCGIKHEPVGNVYREGFDAVWYGERAESFRRRVDECRGCMQGAVEILSRTYRGYAR